VCLFLGVVAGSASVRHLRQLDIHKLAYMQSVTLFAVRLHVSDYVSKYLHLCYRSWDVSADHSRGRANAAHHLLALLLLIYIASVKFEARVRERCSNRPSLDELFLIVVSTIFELVVVL
jgi:hypothetical protein